MSRIETIEHVAAAEGQTVHCERATFVAVAFPSGAFARVRLGFWLAVGMVAGGVSSVGVIALVHKLLSGLFS